MNSEKMNVEQARHIVATGDKRISTQRIWRAAEALLDQLDPEYRYGPVINNADAVVVAPYVKRVVQMLCDGNIDGQQPCQWNGVIKCEESGNKYVVQIKKLEKADAE